MNILEELWFGHISPIEDVVPQNQEYIQTLHQITEKQKSLEQALPSDAFALFDVYHEAQVKLQDLSERAAFSQGFRLGVQLMIAALNK